MTKLRFGIIGAGGIADRRTLPGMRLAKNVEIVAVMEMNREYAEYLKNKYGAEYAYTDVEELLKNPDVDAVYIASPVVFHAKQAMLAADYGKHILLEKPIAMNACEGALVLKHCAEKGVQIAAGFMMRFGSHVKSMRQAVAEGKIGQRGAFGKMAAAGLSKSCQMVDWPQSGCFAGVCGAADCQCLGRCFQGLHLHAGNGFPQYHRLYYHAGGCGYGESQRTGG